MNKAKILIVEDDHTTQLLTAGCLLDANYEVLLAGSGQQALDAVKLDRPDLVLLDLMLSCPMGGEGVLAALVHDPDLSAIPVIIVTGHVSEGTRLLAGQAKTILFKPYEPADLLTKIAEELGKTQHV